MLYVIVHVLPYAASPFHSSNDPPPSPISLSNHYLLHFFFLSLVSLFPFPPSSSLPSSIFHPCFSISAPSIRGLDLSLSLGWFQGFPRLSYKGKTRLERVDIHSMRVKPTFTMQTWISMVSPNKYHEVSRC